MTLQNESLYRAVKRVFGSVIVTDEGAPQTSVVVQSPFGRGRLDRQIVWSGEYYRVNCPHCWDSRQRLWINHAFGIPDPVTRSKRLHLVHCFNEGCINDRVSQQRLYEMLYPFGFGRRPPLGAVGAPPLPSHASPVRPQSLPALPQNLIPLSMPAATGACEYLFSRGFDPGILASRYGVAYSPHSAYPPPGFHDRIVIPIRSSSALLPGSVNCELAGWQARAVGEPNGCTPKYLFSSGLKKSQILYGIHDALNNATGPIVVVEGVTDVWRMGPGAVALFGKTASQFQITQLISFTGQKPLVVLLDSDAQVEAADLQLKLLTLRRRFSVPGPVVLARLPATRTDVGECTFEEAWDTVHRSLLHG